MKTYRRHNCTRKHRTHLATAKCMFPRAAWVTGEGPYATLAWCHVLTVTLHETQDGATAAKQFIDAYNCGHACSRRHEVVIITKPE